MISQLVMQLVIKGATRQILLCIALGMVTTAQSHASGCPCNYVPVTVIDVLSASKVVVEFEGRRETISVARIHAPRLQPDSISDSTWCEAEGAKAREAKTYANRLIDKAKEVSIDERQIDETGQISAVVYVDNISLGQEILYKYLAVEKGEPSPWCPS